MKRVWTISVFLLLSSLLYGQPLYKVSHLLRRTASPLHVQSVQSTPIDSIRILAIMVQFQKDDDPQTTGDGTFQVSGSSAQIDPPPHDSIYFKNKIRFIANYFKRSSNGKLTITGDVYGSIDTGDVHVKRKPIILSKSMSSYSPPTTGNDNQKLIEFVKESWHKADSLYPEIIFKNYDAFVIFHAGVGRNFDFVVTLGYNPVPHDIPSSFLNTDALGAGVAGDSVKNTIILPETDTRVLSGVTIQRSFNSFFAAIIGSYLGLPDLYNTKTGMPGIGQFGLMDGAAIQAYQGLFPPEPSAWEKKYLGWITPIIVKSSTAHLILPAVGLSDVEDTVYQIPISSSEYYLVENRNRNPHGTGLFMTLATASGDSIVHFNQDTAGFQYYDDSLIIGSVVDVSNFDWALIGETDGTGKYDGGGTLIGHIDESVIQTGLSSNSVNANEDHRGVNLEEADGSKDIGQNYEFPDSRSGLENGSPLDCWFFGNSAIPYKNIFDRNSSPASNSNSGAASLITIKDFSTRLPIMTATVEIGNSVLKRDTALSRTLTHASAYPTATKNHNLYLPVHDSIFAFQSNGRSLINNAAGLLSAKKSSFGVAVYQQTANEKAASVYDSALSVFHIDVLHGLKLFDTTLSIAQRFSTSPCFINSSSILVGTESGTLYRFNVYGDTISTRSVGNSLISSIALLPVSSTTNGYYFVAGNRLYSETSISDLPSSSNKWMLAAAVSPKGNYVVAAEMNGNKIISFDSSLTQKLFEVIVPGSALQELAIADINGDGEKDVIIQSATHVSVLSRGGILLDGFPIQVRGTNEFTGTPLIVDFNGDGKLEIITFTNDGEMWVYNQNGKLLTGFPIQVTSPGKSFPMVYTDSSNTGGVAILSENGSLDAFLTSTALTANYLVWWQHLGDESHSSAELTQTVSQPISQDFFPKSRVYNWPNPVYGRSTQIRYYTSENAAITVTILDLSGVKITELKGRGIAGMDCEISWDVSNIQSGVYLARIEAQGNSKSEVTIIKIAVVK